MLGIPENYFEDIEAKIKNGTLTEEDDEQFQENVEKIYYALKKWSFRLFYASLISIIIGISLLFFYFYFYATEFDTETTKIIYIFISGVCFIILGGYGSYFSFKKMEVASRMNKEFEIEEDE